MMDSHRNSTPFNDSSSIIFHILQTYPSKSTFPCMQSFDKLFTKTLGLCVLTNTTQVGLF